MDAMEQTSHLCLEGRLWKARKAKRQKRPERGKCARKRAGQNGKEKKSDEKIVNFSVNFSNPHVSRTLRVWRNISLNLDTNESGRRRSKMKFLACVVVLVAFAHARSRGTSEGLFAFPTTRRGRATAATGLAAAAAAAAAAANPSKDPISDSIAVSGSADAALDKDIIRMLVDSAMREVLNTAGHQQQQPRLPSTVTEPRRVDEMLQFGQQVSQPNSDAIFNDNFPQLAERGSPSFQNAAADVVDLRNEDFSRQANVGVDGDDAAEDDDDDDIRCIPKVMQIEETVYDRAIKCHHSYQEKCHMTYITDYRSTTEEKCETTFKKNCHITFKATPFNETVNICHTPIVRKCGPEAAGKAADICSTHHETNCETRYKTYEIEQDEPVCAMELMRKCQDITLPEPAQSLSGSRFRRQVEEEETEEDGDATTQNQETSGSSSTDGDAGSAAAITVGQDCEEWPVQRCRLEKKTVKKIHPETECRKIPKQVCVPNDCSMQQGDEVCRDEERVMIQNIPQEECELQPEESCHAEAVLVPRLVPKPNCVKVPKEICINTKANPRRVKKPVVKEWCYRPSDLKELNLPQPSTSASPVVQNPQSATSRLFSRISKLLF